jgi:hypothetical protein
MDNILGNSSTSKESTDKAFVMLVSVTFEVKETQYLCFKWLVEYSAASESFA